MGAHMALAHADWTALSLPGLQLTQAQQTHGPRHVTHVVAADVD